VFSARKKMRDKKKTGGTPDLWRLRRCCSDGRLRTAGAGDHNRAFDEIAD
jgi:hypothetical protein